MSSIILHATPAYVYTLEAKLRTTLYDEYKYVQARIQVTVSRSKKSVYAYIRPSKKTN